MGEGGKGGVVYLETKSFARQRYWKYFKSKSADYARIVPNAESDTTVRYIINKKAQTDNFFLARINDKVFISILIIDKETLIKDYGITNKQYGVIIISDIPKNLFSGAAVVR